MHHLSYAQRETKARQEFAQWRESNPNFTSKELLTAWQQIRRAWDVSHEPKPKRKQP